MATATKHANTVNRDALYQAKYCADFCAIGISTWWKWVADGRVQPGHRLGPKTTVWTGNYLLELRDSLIAEAQGQEG